MVMIRVISVHLIWLMKFQSRILSKSRFGLDFNSVILLEFIGYVGLIAWEVKVKDWKKFWSLTEYNTSIVAMLDSTMAPKALVIYIKVTWQHEHASCYSLVSFQVILNKKRCFSSLIQNLIAIHCLKDVVHVLGASTFGSHFFEHRTAFDMVLTILTFKSWNCIGHRPPYFRMHKFTSSVIPHWIH
jgi:hypothetical protein